MQVIHYYGKDLRPGRRIAEAIAGSVEGADARLLRDHGLRFVPDHRPAEYASHQNDRRCTSPYTMHVDMPAADIDQLTWLGVRQHPLVLRHNGRLGKHDFADGK